MNIDNLTYQEADELLRKYPAFAYAALCMYRTADTEAVRDRLRTRLSAMIGSADDVRELLGVDSESLVDFYQDGIPVQMSTDDTISTFIDKFTPAGLPVSDYLASIENMEPQAASQPVADMPAETAEETVTETISESEVEDVPQMAESAPLTESFARILIKNGNYRKALEIISELNLKNSEKSIYFADQIRFLKKLIAIESASRRDDMGGD